MPISSLTHYTTKIMASLSLYFATVAAGAGAGAATAAIVATKFSSSSAPLQPLASLARILKSWCPLSTSFQRLQSTSSDEAVPKSEEQRLKLDAEACNTMDAMADCNEDSNDSALPGAWKWAIWKRVWDLLESKNLAQMPRPMHHRIPNFVGAGVAAANLASLPTFQAAQCVKVNPDTPQKQVRFFTLNETMFPEFS